MTLIEFLDHQVEKAQENVEEYEAFHGKKLSDLKNLHQIDCFLYGVASGKLAMIKELRDLIEELMDRYGDDR